MIYDYDSYMKAMKKQIYKAKREKTYSSRIFGAYRTQHVIGACEYLIHYIMDHQLKPPYNGVVIRDKATISQHNYDGMKYYRRLEILMSLGITNCVDTSYMPKSVSRKFDINPTALLTFYKKAIEKEDEKDLFNTPKFSEYGNWEVDWEYLTKALYTGEWYPIENASEEELKPLEKYFTQIDNCNHLKRFFINTTEEFSTKQIEYIKQYYFNKIVKLNPIYKQCSELSEKLNVKMNFTIHMKKSKNGYTIKVSARQTNKLCNINKKERKEQLLKEGFDGEFDLHSAIYSVARLLNTGKFDCDWDIKKVVDYAAYGISKEEFKQLLMLAFFNDKQSAYRAYSHDCLDKKFTKLSKEDFLTLRDECAMIVGGIEQHQDTIFLNESLLELKVMAELSKREIEYKNVYDCFFFKTNQITENKMKDLINKVAQEIKPANANILPMKKFTVKKESEPKRLKKAQ